MGNGAGRSRSEDYQVDSALDRQEWADFTRWAAVGGAACDYGVVGPVMVLLTIVRDSTTLGIF